MAALPQPDDLYVTIADILSTQSLSSYARALTLVEECIDLIHSSPDRDSPAARALLGDCQVYQARCVGVIRNLTKEACAHEYMVYKRSCNNDSNASVSSRTQQVSRRGQRFEESSSKRRGIMFDVDRGEHVVAALEALRLEEFLQEQKQQEQESEKKVHFL